MRKVEKVLYICNAKKIFFLAIFVIFALFI